MELAIVMRRYLPKHVLGVQFNGHGILPFHPLVPRPFWKYRDQGHILRSMTTLEQSCHLWIHNSNADEIFMSSGRWQTIQGSSR
jgi:hypothetical protein